MTKSLLAKTLKRAKYLRVRPINTDSSTNSLGAQSVNRQRKQGRWGPCVCKSNRERTRKEWRVRNRKSSKILARWNSFSSLSNNYSKMFKGKLFSRWNFKSSMITLCLGDIARSGRSLGRNEPEEMLSWESSDSASIGPRWLKTQQSVVITVNLWGQHTQDLAQIPLIQEGLTPK